MACLQTVQRGAVGVDIIGTITEDGAVVDISLVSTKQIILRKPDGTTVTRTASFVTNGSDGKLFYRTLAGDLDKVGAWKSQAYVVFPGGFDGRSSIDYFEVARNL